MTLIVTMKRNQPKLVSNLQNQIHPFHFQVLLHASLSHEASPPQPFQALILTGELWLALARIFFRD